MNTLSNIITGTTAAEFLDRDISWLSFNRRVLDETDKNISIKEKCLFFGITLSNLREFLMVRYPAYIEEYENSKPELIEDFNIKIN